MAILYSANGQVIVLAAAAVPEPSTLILLSFALGGLAVLRWRRGSGG